MLVNRIDRALLKSCCGVLVALFACTHSLGESVASDRVSYPGRYAGYANEQFDSYVRTSQLVPVRDGVRLAVTIYRPAVGGVPTSEPLPVLFSFTPYLSRRIDEHGVVTGVVERGRGPTRPFVELTRYGYVVAVADVRGKGSSFGVRAAYADRLEGEDGHDLVEWLAAQPWSDGKVGMFGCSYVGGTQWATARNLPPHLKAIFPQAAQFDSYRNVRRGGISGQFNTRPQDIDEDFPTAPVDEDADGSLKRAALEQHKRNGEMLDLVTKLEFRDDRTDEDVQYWPLSSPYRQSEKMRAAGISVYSWGTWMDEPADQSLISYENMRGGKGLNKLLMGPGGHCDIDTIDSFAEHLRFFDHTLKGIDNGIDREPPIAFKTIGLPEAEAWRFSDGFPFSTKTQRLYFTSQGKLSTKPESRTRTTRYEVTYGVGCEPPKWAMPGFGREEPVQVGEHTLPPPGYWACVNPAVAKSWSTDPFPSDVWLSGFSILNLTFSSTRPENFVFAYLEDVAPSGEATLIAHGRLHSSHRHLGEAPYRNFGLPWASNLRADARPLAPGETATLRFELSPTSRIIPAGHRLRVSFTGADQRQRNLAELAVDPPPVWDLTLGGASGSHWEVTLLPVQELLSTTRPIAAATNR
jgi:putative CocE/NonD family hydrolase